MTMVSDSINNLSLPLVSVVVPVFNKSEFLVEAVESVVSQQSCRIEVLLRDDGSTDASWSVIESLHERFPGVSFVTMKGENLGASACRNILIETANADLVILMDADDIMLPGFIAKATEAIQLHKARVVYSDVELQGAKETEWCPPPFDPYAIRYDNCLTSLSMIDRKLWREVGGYQTALPFNEDWSFFMRAARISNSFHKLEGKYFRYRQTGSGLYQSFILDNWNYNRSLLMVANTDCYGVDEVLQASRDLHTMPTAWIPKFEVFERRFHDQTLPKIVLSLAATAKGNYSAALNHIRAACEVAAPDEWLPFVLLAQLAEPSDRQLTLSCLHTARIRRPDIGRLVNPHITRLLSIQK